MRAAEAIAARDVIAQHLSSACKSIRDKSATIDTLRQQNKYLEDLLKEHHAAYTPQITTSGATKSCSRDDRAPPAGQEGTLGCIGQTNENPKAQSNTLREELSNSEEEPPKYEATEAFSQVLLSRF